MECSKQLESTVKGISAELAETINNGDRRKINDLLFSLRADRTKRKLKVNHSRQQEQFNFFSPLLIGSIIENSKYKLIGLVTDMGYSDKTDSYPYLSVLVLNEDKYRTTTWSIGSNLSIVFSHDVTIDHVDEYFPE